MWVKICGITVHEDMLAAAGADAVGLNFYAPSKRYVSPSQAARLVAAASPSQQIVGVFVNSPVEEVVEIVDLAGLTAVQFHGDESVETVASFHSCRQNIDLIRAFRIGQDGLAPVDSWLQKLSKLNIELKAILVDAFVPGEFGGTGHRISPCLLESRDKSWPPLILAGGLTPETVAQSIADIAPWGVDTASGVEDKPGIKNHELVERFISIARESQTGNKLI